MNTSAYLKKAFPYPFKQKLKNGLSVSDIIKNSYVTFNNDNVYRLFAPFNFVSTAWSGSVLINKNTASQSVDFACLFRLMLGNSRFTLTERLSGYIDLRIRSADGTVQKDAQSTVVPTLNHDIGFYYSWNLTNLTLVIWDFTSNTLVESIVVSASTSLVVWTEADGLYIGNRADGTLPYNGLVYGGTLKAGIGYTSAELQALAASGNLVPADNFYFDPQFFGRKGTVNIAEPHGLDLILTPTDPTNLTNFWGA